jgi:hypothetical protein
MAEDGTISEEGNRPGGADMSDDEKIKDYAKDFDDKIYLVEVKRDGVWKHTEFVYMNKRAAYRMIFKLRQKAGFAQDVRLAVFERVPDAVGDTEEDGPVAG